MSVVSKIKLPSNTTVDIHDARVSDPTSSDSGKVLSVTDTSGTLGWVTPATEIYWCTYGTTTFAELTTAWNEGKQILCFWSNRVYNLIYVGSSFTFGYVWGSTTYRLACSSSSVWSNTSDSNQSQITVTGLLKGNGSGSVTAAVAGTDYQGVLVSGTNIKTINNESLLGSGNITIQGGGSLTPMTNAEIDSAVNSAWAGAPSTISFTIANVSYQAEDEMTWAQWVASGYNTSGYALDGNYITDSVNSNWLYYGSTMVLKTDTIVTNGTYELGPFLDDD